MPRLCCPYRACRSNTRLTLPRLTTVAPFGSAPASPSLALPKTIETSASPAHPANRCRDDPGQCNPPGAWPAAARHCSPCHEHSTRRPAAPAASCDCLPRPSTSRQACRDIPVLALPCSILSSPRLPRVAAPTLASPALTLPALALTAIARHAYRRMPVLTGLATPRLTRTIVAVACRACLAMPEPSHCMPIATVARLAKPAVLFMPRISASCIGLPAVLSYSRVNRACLAIPAAHCVNQPYPAPRRLPSLCALRIAITDHAPPAVPRSACPTLSAP